MGFQKYFYQKIPLRFRLKLRRFALFLGAVLLGITIGIGALAFVSAADIYEYNDTVDGVHLPRVDAIVVLAGGRGRIAAAGDVWYRYWELSQGLIKGISENPVPQETPLLYISGMGHLSNWGVVARQVRRGVLGVLKPENVVLETESVNTEDNARWLARYARAHGWEHILLVTSPYHMKRARYIFEKVLSASALEKALSVETLSIFQEPFEPVEWRHSLHGIRVTLFEYLKWVYYKHFCHPV